MSVSEMTMSRPLFVFAVLSTMLVALPITVDARQPVDAKTVTNAAVVEMTEAGLSDQLIVGAIEDATEPVFDLSPSAMIELKRLGVSNLAIQAMRARLQVESKKVQGTLQTAPGDMPAPAPEVCRVFITEEEPPSGFYTVVRKEVQVGKKFYGSHDDKLMYELSKQAARVGADAIIGFHEWRAPSAFSWAAAKAGGMAVKWTSAGLAAIPSLKGQCWSAKGRP